MDTDGTTITKGLYTPMNNVSIGTKLHIISTIDNLNFIPLNQFWVNDE